MKEAKGMWSGSLVAGVLSVPAISLTPELSISISV